MLGNFWKNKILQSFGMRLGVHNDMQSLKLTRGKFWGDGVRGTHALPISCNHLLFCNRFGELQTVLFEVELIINNAS